MQLRAAAPQPGRWRVAGEEVGRGGAPHDAETAAPCRAEKTGVRWPAWRTWARGGSTCPPAAPDLSPLLVYFHGGGYVCGDLDTHDSTCRFLATEAVRVLSVDYRLALEHLLPALIEDGMASRYAVDNAADLGADPERDRGGRRQRRRQPRRRRGPARPRRGSGPRVQPLLYLAADWSRKSESYRLFREGLSSPRPTWTGTAGTTSATTPTPRGTRERRPASRRPGGRGARMRRRGGLDPLRDAHRLRQATRGRRRANHGAYLLGTGARLRQQHRSGSSVGPGAPGGGHDSQGWSGPCLSARGFREEYDAPGARNGSPAARSRARR